MTSEPRYTAAEVRSHLREFDDVAARARKVVARDRVGNHAYMLVSFKEWTAMQLQLSQLKRKGRR